MLTISSGFQQAYCGTGCQPGLGTCTGPVVSSSIVSSSEAFSTMLKVSSTSVLNPSSTLVIASTATLVVASSNPDASSSSTSGLPLVVLAARLSFLTTSLPMLLTTSILPRVLRSVSQRPKLSVLFTFSGACYLSSGLKFTPGNAHPNPGIDLYERSCFKNLASGTTTASVPETTVAPGGGLLILLGEHRMTNQLLTYFKT